MIKRSNKFAWVLIVVFPIFLYCKRGISQISGTITLLDKPVPNNDLNKDTCFAEAYCERRISYFNFDSAFTLDQKYSDSPYILEECLQCSLLKLIVNSDTVDLDSVYRMNFKNRTVLYMAGFVEGSYIVSNGVTNIRLIFINLRTNTSTDTSHEYLIIYDSRKKKLISVTMRFLKK
jgi:hypothetical protein